MTVAVGRMTYRAAIERDSASGTDKFKQKVAPIFAPLATVQCWAWSTTRREQIGTEKNAVLEDLRMIVPLNTDITENDRIASIKDRRDRVKFGGPLRIEAVVRRVTHLEVVLDKVNQ